MPSSRETIRSSRRNIFRMGAVVAAAVVAKATPAAADRWDDDRKRNRSEEDRKHHHHHVEDRQDKEHHCFLKGTLIRTVQGDKKIEDLTVGNLVPTVFGGETPIKSVART